MGIDQVISKMPNLLGATWDSLDSLDIPWCNLKQLDRDWEKCPSILKWSQAASSELKDSLSYLKQDQAY